jgi:hypothetical protein
MMSWLRQVFIETKSLTTNLWQTLKDLNEIGIEAEKSQTDEKNHPPDKAKKTTSPDYSFLQQEADNEAMRQTEPLKARGDGYELLIGRQFEQKGDLVIYNGFIRGYNDQGVDLIVISKRNRSVNLVQCKNWLRYEITVERVAEIYEKLCHYTPDYFTIPYEQIRYYSALPKTESEINEQVELSRDYTIRKSLYISSDRVVNLELGEHLTMTGENIFRYQDMKMVVKGWEK